MLSPEPLTLVSKDVLAVLATPLSGEGVGFRQGPSQVKSMAQVVEELLIGGSRFFQNPLEQDQALWERTSLLRSVKLCFSSSSSCVNSLVFATIPLKASERNWLTASKELGAEVFASNAAATKFSGVRCIPTVLKPSLAISPMEGMLRILALGGRGCCAGNRTTWANSLTSGKAFDEV